MNLTLVDVALPVPLAQLFTYSIPPQFETMVSKGSAVIVPFGKKTMTGVVIGFTTVKPNFTIKSITDVVDVNPYVLSNDLTLSEWISEYYHTPLGDTIKLFLPAGFSQKSKRIISLSETYSGPKNFSRQDKKIVESLGDSSLTLAQLQKKTGIKSIHALLGDLSTRGVITIEEQQSKKQSPKFEWHFERISDDATDTFRGKKQQVVWNAIRMLPDGPVGVTNFLKTHSTTSAVLKSLAQKKLISLVRTPVSRTSSFQTDEQAVKSLTIQLNGRQKDAVEQITAAINLNTSRHFLLYGITGSGKTQVYIEAIRHALSLNRSAIVLIPEISLTPQTVKRFQIHFGDRVVWMHSRMSDGERYDAWRLSREGKYRIVIGPRSALFAPLKDIGLIIVDEEHESSYKQFDANPRYNARDVAIMRASLHNAVAVLGSATPSIESYTNAVEGKFLLLNLPERADHAVLPPVTIINMLDERKRVYAEAKINAKQLGKKAFENLSRSISSALELRIRDRLEKKEGIILLQNRRGFAPFIECTSCGHVEQCDRCNVTMTFHSTKKHMRCHYCGNVRPAPTVCSQCGAFEFSLNGFGTQRVEQELITLFPQAKILRMDMDTTTKKGAHEKILRQFGEGHADILLGTQMVAKGLDFPRVTLVGVISADTQMMLPDFRSAERTFQLLTQVAGRAGRSTLAGEVIIQTSQPGHYALKHVQNHDFVGFYNEEIEYRRSINYPPFSRVIVIEFKGKVEKHVEEVALTFGKKISAMMSRDALLGPAPAVLSKIKNDYRWQMIIKANKATDKNGTRARHSVARVVQDLQKKSASLTVKVIVDVDPTGIL